MLNEIICADVIDGLWGIDDDSVHLTFTSPPYNVNLNYKNSSDNLTYADYLKWLENVFYLIYKKTVSGGRIAINIDAITNREDDKDQEYVRAIYPHLYNIMKKIGWKFRTEICWSKQNAVGRATAWGSYMSSSNPCLRRNHEYVLVWSKDDWKLESEEKSDMTKQEFELYTLSTWHVQPQTRKLAGHPAGFPEELAKRVIKLFSFPGQTILDPFSGTGTTAKVAYMWNRNYLGIDNCEDYCEFARNRIAEVEQIDAMEELLCLPKKDKTIKKGVESTDMFEDEDE
jgi:DNA modification methylase